MSRAQRFGAIDAAVVHLESSTAPVCESRLTSYRTKTAFCMNTFSWRKRAEEKRGSSTALLQLYEYHHFQAVFFLFSRRSQRLERHVRANNTQERSFQ